MQHDVRLVPKEVFDPAIYKTSPPGLQARGLVLRVQCVCGPALPHASQDYDCRSSCRSCSGNGWRTSCRNLGNDGASQNMRNGSWYFAVIRIAC